MKLVVFLAVVGAVAAGVVEVDDCGEISQNLFEKYEILTHRSYKNFSIKANFLLPKIIHLSLKDLLNFD